MHGLSAAAPPLLLGAPLSIYISRAHGAQQQTAAHLCAAAVVE